MAKDINHVSEGIKKLSIDGSETSNNFYVGEVIVEKHVHYYLNLSKEVEDLDNGLQGKAKIIVDYWIAATKQITNIADEEMGLNILSSLSTLAKLPNSSKSFCVLCLVLLMKQDKFKKVQSAASSAISEICESSNLFMLFMQVNKIYSKAHKTSGWGRGVRRAACNWYLKWEPKMLALEVSRYPGAYSWKHKDVLKMAHINKQKLPIGILLVIRNIMNGFERTKCDFSSNENASELLRLLEILQIKKNECSDADKMVERAKKIYKEFGSLMLEDFPSVVYNEPKVLDFILSVELAPVIVQALIKTRLFDHCCNTEETTSKLVAFLGNEKKWEDVNALDILVAYNVCRRKAIRKTDDVASNDRWMNYATPSLEKYQRINLIKIIDENSKKIIEFLGDLLTKVTSKCKKTEKSACVFIDNGLSMKSYIDISDDQNGSKEITALQAASLTLFYLASNSRFDVVTPYAATPQGFVALENLPRPCSLHIVKTKLKKLELTMSNLRMIEEALKVAVYTKKDTCIFLCFEVMQGIYDAAEQVLTQIKTKDKEQKLRVIICGMRFPDPASRLRMVTSRRDDIVIVPGFNRCALPTIRDYHEQQL